MSTSPTAADLSPAVDRWHERFGAREPQVEAFLPENGRFERLRREVENLARRFPDPDERPPLFGVPVGVKDVFAITGLPRRAGTDLPASEFEGAEAAVVTRLRDAGAVVLGRTVTTELAYFAPGPTRNPHRPDHTPGGSSSGSAAAVAAGLVPLALGTQTIGSVIRPAAYCGVVGFKPSYGRVPCDGLVPLAPSYDHVGWLARDLDLATRAARVLVTGWEETASEGDRRRLAVPEGPYLEHVEEDALASFRDLLDDLRTSGVDGIKIVPIPTFEDFREIELRHRELLAYDFAQAHWDLYARHGGAFDTRTAALLEQGRRISPDRAAEIRAERTPLARRLDAQLAEHQADAWITPAATGPAPKGLGSTGDPILNLPWTQAGLPALGLPAGTVRGLPVGLQVVGRFGGDEALLALGTLLVPHLPDTPEAPS